MNVKDPENSPLLQSNSSENSDVEDQQNSPDEVGENRKCFNPLIVIIIVLTISLISLLGFVYFIRAGDGKAETAKRKVCRTNECLTISSQLLNWRNPKIDPCDDFYEFTCGRYSEHRGTDGTRIVEKELIVKRLISEFVHKNENSTSKSENTLKQLYWRCYELKDSAFAKSQEERIYQEVLANIRKIGSWPTLEGKAWSSANFSLNDMLANMAKLHLRDFGMFEVIYFEHQEIGTTKQLLIKPSEIQLPLPKVEMMELARNILLSNGYDHMKKNLEKDVEEFYELEDKLRKMPAELTLTEASYSQLKSHIPSIDFDRILKNLLHPKFGNWTILKNKLATMKFDAFFGEGNNLEQTIRNASSRKLANYLVFKYLESAYSYITVNKQVVDPRPCDELLVNVLPRASLRVFVQKYFNKENLKLASRMVDETKNTYMEMIHASTWLDESTKTEAIHKVAEMRKMVGYTEEYERKGALDEIFETLPTSSSDSFYTLVTKIQRFRTEQLMDFITSDTLLNPTEPLMVANAFYFSLKNSLNILVPFLDDPLFDAKFPKYVNAAGIGRVLAHEIGHAFDIHGRLANYNGSVVDWWTEKNRIEYEKKTKCLVDQYERYVNPDYGRSMNGTRVLSEMIADIVGTEAAWKTFQKMNLTDELDLYGFEYASFDQLYFQIAALDFCAPRDKSPIWKIFAMEHPTNRFRVNGVFSNLKAFADTFKCPAGSPMNPDTRCELF